jgi:hypothetical protein
VCSWKKELFHNIWMGKNHCESFSTLKLFSFGQHWKAKRDLFSSRNFTFLNGRQIFFFFSIGGANFIVMKLHKKYKRELYNSWVEQAHEKSYYSFFFHCKITHLCTINYYPIVSFESHLNQQLKKYDA